MQEVRVWSLTEDLRFHMSQEQKDKQQKSPHITEAMLYQIQ